MTPNADTPDGGDHDAIDVALAHVLADGAAADRIARTVLADPAAPAERRALAWAAIAQVAFREGTVEAGAAALSRAESEAGAVPSVRLQTMLDHTRAQRLRREGRLAEAAELLSALHARADERPLADAYLSAAALGIVESMRGAQDRALDLMYQALHLARRSGIASYRVNALSNLGSFESDHYNLEDATPMLEEALEGALQLGSRRQLIFAAGNLVQTLCLRGEAGRALAVAREHLIPTIRPDDPPALRRDDEIAAALLANGLVDEAEAVLGHEVYDGALTNELATVRVMLLARIHLLRGRPAQALALCLARREEIATGGEQVTLPIDRVDLLRLAARAAAEVGDPAQAHALLLEAFGLYEALLGRAARSRRLSLQIVHRLHQAEWERDGARQIAAALETVNASLRAEAAENERLKRQLMAHALEDPLTGLYNRRHLFEAGTRLLATQRRRGGGMAAALIDLDHFKQVNDLHGHDAGDRVLRAFAGLLQRETRAGDVACRYGGEEFVVLMADADARQAADRMRSLLAVFGALEFDGTDGPFRCSFSAGTAGWLGGDETLEALLRRADGVLYAAKAGGRATVRAADDAPLRGPAAPA